ncbi:MAG: pyrroline-5-carboxylate reductase, partial [Oscillospiraceae bacterium]|nr:pyrroline-5-carboxylate reductase [Oscillospiraceae bacterium]
LVRVMPNINARVQSSVSAICPNEAATQEQTDIVRAMFETVGGVWQLSEQHFPAFAAIGGASGAFVYLYIDALASAGVKAGLPRDLAQEIACHTVLGSAKLQLASEEHPVRLCDQVCSPGGTTIEGVHMLKKLGFESAVQQAIAAIIEKDHKLANS